MTSSFSAALRSSQVGSRLCSRVLGQVLRDAADRQCRKNAAIDNEQAAVLLYDFHKQLQRSSETTKNAVDQFLAAARTGQRRTARDSRRCSTAGQLLAKTLRKRSEHGRSRSSPCSFGQRRSQWGRCLWRNHKQLNSWGQVAAVSSKAGSQISGLVVDKFRRSIHDKARAHGR